MEHELSVGSREEVERMRRVSDQMCSAHAALADRFRLMMTISDVVALLLSAWVSALAFVDPRIAPSLVPPGLEPVVWIGVIGLIIFAITLVQMRMDWRGSGEAHKRSLAMYAEVKREAGYLLASAEVIPPREFQRLAARYDMATDVGANVPEGSFLKLKRRHKLKVEISKLLDKQPGASISLTKLKILIRDNLQWPKK